MLLGMPNNMDPRLPHLREIALVAHCLPHALVRLTLDDGRTLDVGHHPGCVLRPCQLRLAVAAVRAGRIAAGWLDHVAAARLLEGPCRHLGAGLYTSHCAGTPVFGFVSSLPTDALVAALSDHDEPDAEVRVLPDPLLDATLVTLEATARTGTPRARHLARDLQALVLVTELDLDLARVLD